MWESQNWGAADLAFAGFWSDYFGGKLGLPCFLSLAATMCCRWHWSPYCSKGNRSRKQYAWTAFMEILAIYGPCSSWYRKSLSSATLSLSSFGRNLWFFCSTTTIWRPCCTAGTDHASSTTRTTRTSSLQAWTLPCTVLCTPGTPPHELAGGPQSRWWSSSPWFSLSKWYLGSRSY